MLVALGSQTLTTPADGSLGNVPAAPDEMCLFCLLPRWAYSDGACCSWNRADGNPKNSPPIYKTKELTVAKETAVETVSTAAAAVSDSLGLKQAVWIMAGLIGLALAWKIKEF